MTAQRSIFEPEINYALSMTLHGWANVMVAKYPLAQPRYKGAAWMADKYPFYTGTGLPSIPVVSFVVGIADRDLGEPIRAFLNVTLQDGSQLYVVDHSHGGMLALDLLSEVKELMILLEKDLAAKQQEMEKLLSVFDNIFAYHFQVDSPEEDESEDEDAFNAQISQGTNQ